MPFNDWVRERRSRQSPQSLVFLQLDEAGGAVRIVRYSPAAGFVLTVIAIRLDAELWGVTAWKTIGAERRNYQEAHKDTI